MYGHSPRLHVEAGMDFEDNYRGSRIVTCVGHHAL